MSKMIITLLLALFLGLGEAGFAAAQSSPQALIETTAQQMQQALRANRQTLEADRSKIYGLVHQIVLPHFDFELMSQWVLGKYWRQATPEQRNLFTNEFRTLLVRSYAGALLEYTDDKITYPPAPALAADAQEATVHSKVQVKNGEPIDIDYHLRFRNGAWKVYDVAVNGVSLVINYRSTFANQIRDGGMEAVIRDLRERNAKSTT